MEKRNATEETSEQRRKRFKALKESQQHKEDDIQKPTTSLEMKVIENTQDHESFIENGNHTDQDESATEIKIDTALAPSIQAEKELQKYKELEEGQDDRPLNLAPKKPNWDLKRDVESKMKKLEKRTQRAIVEIIRERLEREREEESDSDEEEEEEDD